MKTVIEQQPQIEWKFPCLAKNKYNDLMVLVTCKTEDNIVGTVIQDCDSYGIGYYSDCWYADNFTPITTPLTITFIPE